MRKERLIAGALAGVTTVAVIGGCAAREVQQALEPKLELRNAAHQLADAQQVGYTLTLRGSADDLIAAAKRDKSVGAPDAEEAKVIRQLFTSSVTIGYDKGGPDVKDDKAMIAATIAGVTGTEIRFVDETIYAKAPVAEVAAKFGADPKEVESDSREAAAALPGLDAFFKGQWVSISSKDVTDLAGKSTGLPTQTLNQQNVAKEFGAAANDLLEGASVVRDSADAKHLIVTSSTTKAFEAAKRMATAVQKNLADQMTDGPEDQPIVVDLWIDGGKFTAAELNVMQFIKGATGRVALHVDVTSGAPITAPTDATKIDTTALAKSLRKA